jgi:hypothetical protein
MPPLGNPAEAIRIFSDLAKRFESFDYESSMREDFATVKQQLERLRATVVNVFGNDSTYVPEVNISGFRYPRAKQRNAINYFNQDKTRILTLLHKILDELRIAYPGVMSSVEEMSVPLAEPQDSLALFHRDHPTALRTTFIMMSFADTPAHIEITNVIRSTLSSAGIIGLRADDKDYHPDLYPNILTYMHGCGFGVAVFDDTAAKVINPNVAFEVGYMLALKKPVCLLKDKNLPNLQADLIGKLYITFDPQQIRLSIQAALSRWLTDHIT